MQGQPVVGRQRALDLPVHGRAQAGEGEGEGVDVFHPRTLSMIAQRSLTVFVLYERNGYTAEWSPPSGPARFTRPELAERVGRRVARPRAGGPLGGARRPARRARSAGGCGELYRARGFVFPGRPGSAPPLLAQHDWVHVLADYGTTVESELEVFAFIARANDDMRAFSLLAMVVSLFETGYLRAGRRLFEAFPGQLSQAGWPCGSPTRCAGARSATTGHGRPTASTSCASTGSRWPTVPSTRRERVRRRPEVRRGRGRRVGRAVGAGRHQPVPAGRRPRAGRAPRDGPTTPTAPRRCEPALPHHPPPVTRSCSLMKRPMRAIEASASGTEPP